MIKLFIILGSVAAFFSVALGAFAAHTLKPRLSADMLEVFLTATQYQGYHALGLILIGVIGHHIGHSTTLKWSGWLMVAGIVLFSGSLYILSLTGYHRLGAITPFGGLAFLTGWLLLAIATLRGPTAS